MTTSKSYTIKNCLTVLYWTGLRLNTYIPTIFCMNYCVVYTVIIAPKKRRRVMESWVLFFDLVKAFDRVSIDSQKVNFPRGNFPDTKAYNRRGSTVTKMYNWCEIWRQSRTVSFTFTHCSSNNYLEKIVQHTCL